MKLGLDTIITGLLVIGALIALGGTILILLLLAKEVSNIDKTPTPKCIQQVEVSE